MKIDYIFLIGMVATTLTGISVLPQIIKTWKTKKTDDLSLWMYVISVTSVSLWIIYAVLIGSIPLLITDLLLLVSFLTVLGFKLKYG